MSKSKVGFDFLMTVFVMGSVWGLGGCGTGPARTDSSESSPSSDSSSSADSSPSSSTVSPSPRAVATPAAAPQPAAAKETLDSGVDPGIVPTTRRSSLGLTEPLPDYPSWSLRKPASPAKTDGASPHLEHRSGYAYQPPGKNGDLLQTSGAVLVLEEKKPGTNFIAQVTALEKTEQGWKPLAFHRAFAGDAFVQADISRCGSCHQ